MDANSLFFLDQQKRKFNAQCSGAIVRIKRCDSLLCVVRALDSVRPDPLIRHLGGVPALHRSVQQTADSRAAEFVDKLIERIKSHEHVDGEVRLALTSLQGRFPSLYVKLDLAWRSQVVAHCNG